MPVETDQVLAAWPFWLLIFTAFVLLLLAGVYKFTTTSSITNSRLLHFRSRNADQLDTAGEALEVLAAILMLALFFLF